MPFKSLHQACLPVVMAAFHKRNELYEGSQPIQNVDAIAGEALLSIEAGDLQGAMIRVDELRAYLNRLFSALHE